MTEPSVEPDLALEHAVCTACGCLCDDIGLRFHKGKTAEVRRACSVGEKWLNSLCPIRLEAFLRGKPAPLDEALMAAGRLLSAAKAPVLLGLTQLSVEALREAAALSEAVVAPLLVWPEPQPGLARSGLHAPECTATLGEVRASADLVVFWRADPVRTHPRHLERYSLEPPLLDGRRRLAFVLDFTRDNSTLSRADDAVTLDETAPRSLWRDVEIVRAVRLLVERGEAPGADTATDEATRGAALRLLERLRASRHAHFFLGHEAAASPALWDELGALAARAREKHRITISAMPGPGNARGALEVLTWRLGPQSVGPGAERTLSTGATDLVLALGLEVDAAAEPAFSKVASVARISIGHIHDPGATAAIRTPGLDPRLHASVVRSDGIHLTLDGRQGSTADLTAHIIRRLRKAATLSPQA